MWARQLCFVQTTRHTGSQFLNQGLNPRPLHLKHRVLTTGEPGKFPGKLFDCLGASDFPLTRTGRVVPHRLLRGTNTKARNFKIPKILCGSLTSSRQMAGGFLKNIRLVKKKNQVAKKWHVYVLICHGVRCLLTRGSTCWSSAFLVFLEEHGWKLNYLWLCLQCRRPWFNSWVEKICWRRDRYPLQYSGLENSMDYSPWGHKELDTTEGLALSVILPFPKLLCFCLVPITPFSSYITHR